MKHGFIKILQAWIVQTLYTNIVINSRSILQKSISMSMLSTSVQVLTKNKPNYLKTNLGLMKIRDEVLSATQRFEFEKIENLKKVRKMIEQRRKPKNTESNFCTVMANYRIP